MTHSYNKKTTSLRGGFFIYAKGKVHFCVVAHKDKKGYYSQMGTLIRNNN